MDQKYESVRLRDQEFSAMEILALGLSLLLALVWLNAFSFDSLLENGIPGLGVFVFTISALSSEIAYLKGKVDISNGLFLGLGSVSVALGCFLTGNYVLRLMSISLLAVILPMAAFSLSGNKSVNWKTPRSVWETVKLFFPALFRACPLPVFAVLRRRSGAGRIALGAIAGLCLTVPLLIIVMYLLISADQIFGGLLNSFTDWLMRVEFWEIFRHVLRTVIFSLIFFSLLYTLKHPNRKTEKTSPIAPTDNPDMENSPSSSESSDLERRSQTAIVTESSPAYIGKICLMVVLTLLNAVYLIFCTVQVLYLFGGAESAAMSGGYAQYARSGFFQLVAVAAINLSVMLSSGALASSPRGKAVRVESLILTGLTLVILSSALMRMCLYIGEYGLSLLRIMTLWAMAFILVCLSAAAVRCCRQNFKFWPVFISAAIWGWAIFTILRPDVIVADYNLDAYLSGDLPSIDVEYISSLSPQAREVLEAAELDLY